MSARGTLILWIAGIVAIGAGWWLTVGEFVGQFGKGACYQAPSVDENICVEPPVQALGATALIILGSCMLLWLLWRLAATALLPGTAGGIAAFAGLWLASMAGFGLAAMPVLYHYSQLAKAYVTPGAGPLIASLAFGAVEVAAALALIQRRKPRRSPL